MSMYLRNLKKRYSLHNTTSFSPIVLLIFLSILLIAVYSSPVTAGPYLDSAHGNTSYGVNRVRTAGFGYTRGNCAHCHEQHASIEGEELASPAPYHFAMFYDDFKDTPSCQMLCTTCHSSDSTYQQVTNYPYCKNFGGADPTWYGDIYTQFCDQGSGYLNCGSKHHLEKIHDILTNPAVAHWGFNDDPNPCVACHPPHTAQRNYPVSFDGEKLRTAIRRPSHYKSTNPQDFLWGDDDNRLGEPERMDEYAALSVGGTYQAPYYGDTSGTKFEPSGNESPSDGSDLPNYVTFCMDCHHTAQYDPERLTSVRAIDWSSNGDRHGAAPANTCIPINPDVYEGSLKPPYTDSPNSNYILSCLDCHEPHGTYKRQHLIRLWINGMSIGYDTSGSPYSEEFAIMCEPCHNFNHGGSCTSTLCHGGGIGGQGFHGGTFIAAGAGDCEGYPSF